MKKLTKLKKPSREGYDFISLQLHLNNIFAY